MKIGVFSPESDRWPLSLRRYYEAVRRSLRGCELVPFESSSPSDVDVLWDPFCAGGRFPEWLAGRRPFPPVVVTLHGAAPFSLPHADNYENAKAALTGELGTLTALDSWLKHGSRINACISPSSFAKSENCLCLGLPNDKIAVVYHGVDNQTFSPNGFAETKVGFLHVSAVQPKKNLDRLMDAYARMPVEARPPMTLIVPGLKNRRHFEMKGVRIIEDPLSPAALVPFFRGALAFAFPSLHETFGLPVAEAMASGCPVLTSKGSALEEIYDDAALLVDPRNTDAIKDGLTRLSADAELRVSLREKGFEKAASLTWEFSAEKHLEVFRRAARSSRTSRHQVVSAAVGSESGADGGSKLRNKAIIVLGMHRSGTSAMARVLNLLGVELGGPLNPPGEDNKKGFWEHAEIVAIHDRLLKSLDSRWDNLCPLPDDWLSSPEVQSFKNEILDVLRRNFGDSLLWGIKDPRLCRLLPLWESVLEELGCDWTCLVMVRDPSEVIASLTAREGDNLPVARSRVLWLDHVLSASQITGRPKAFVAYDDLLFDWRGAMERVAESLGISWPRSYEEAAPEIQAFLDPSLRHQRASGGEERTPELVKQTYAAVKAAASGRGAASAELLASLRAQYRSSAELFSPFLRKADHLHGRLQYWEALAEERASQIEHWEREVAAREREIRWILDSTSWRLTRPARFVGQRIRDCLAVFRGKSKPSAQRMLARVGLSRWIWRSGRVFLRGLPVSSGKKEGLKAFVYTKFEFLFSETPGYLFWKRYCSENSPGTSVGAFRPSGQAASHAIRPLTLIQIGSEGVLGLAQGIRFDFFAEPLVSIIVPAFNKFEFTVCCLASISQHRPACGFEVILIDDGSSDDTPHAAPLIQNLRYIRNPENMGFIRSCNKGAREARGKYLVFLNNDTQVLPGWLEGLVNAIMTEPDAGIIGSKLVYPSGHLQEAGCVLKPDGSVELVGLNENPADAKYNFRRETDCCSGASLLVEKRLFLELNGFDEEFLPACFEDSDMCLRVRKRGGKVLYEPSSVVAHHLSATTRNKLALVEKNREKFVARWRKDLEALDQVRLIAFYLPQYHPIPENDLWWGKGFTEWSNVAKSKPSFEGHYQPHLPADLGFYDLRLPETRREQADLAKRYGVHGFCYYYYWFGKGKKLLQRPLEEMLALGEPDMPFCVCWANENWTRRWDGLDSEILIAQDHSKSNDADFIEEMLPLFQDGRYIRINGKPLLLVYNALALPDPLGVTEAWRRRCRDAGIGEIYLAAVEHVFGSRRGFEPKTLGFDAAVEFPPHGLAKAASAPGAMCNPEFNGTFYDYGKTAEAFLRRETPSFTLFRTAMPSWDNTARRQNDGDIFLNSSPEAYERWLSALIRETRKFRAGDEKIVFINAWNEWAEGNHLEPDKRYGHGFLEATRRALEQNASGPSVQGGKGESRAEPVPAGRRLRVGIGLVEHFGDIVACEPVIRHLRERHPDSEIAWVARKPYRELLEHHPQLDETVAVDCLTDWIKLVEGGAFDEVVDLHVNGRVCPKCNIPLSKKKGRLSINGDNYFFHGSLLHSFCIGAGLPPLNDAPKAYIPSAIVDKVKTFGLPKEYAVFHCLSNEPAKDWDAAKWNLLASWAMEELGVQVVEVGTVPVLAEREGVHSLVGRTSLLEMAEVIRGAALFVGVDSGPAHLANAVETPGVVLLGRYRDFPWYNPFTGGFADGSKAELLRNEAGAASGIGVDAVREAVAKRLGSHRRTGSAQSRPEISAV